jgi:hypothetical protein
MNYSMGTIIDEITQAKNTLKLDSGSCRLLSEKEARDILNSITSKFVNNANRRWWWEDFKAEGFSRKFENGFQRICELVPDPNETVLLICEEDQLNYFPVYEATPKTIQSVISECYGFEYYIVPKDLSWLLCENHHDMMIAVGSIVEERLKTLSG